MGPHPHFQGDHVLVEIRPGRGRKCFQLEKAALELGLQGRGGWALQRRVEGMQLGYLGVACCRMGKRDEQGEIWEGWSLGPFTAWAM